MVESLYSYVSRYVSLNKSNQGHLKPINNMFIITFKGKPNPKDKNLV